MTTLNVYDNRPNPDIIEPPQDMEEVVICRKGTVPDDPEAPPSRFKFLQLVQPGSKVKERGEAPEGTLYCKEVGVLENLEAEPTGFYLEQRYDEYHPATKSFTSYCRAVGNDLRTMIGKGEPGGNCLKCNLRQWTEETVRGTSQTKRVPPACRSYTNFEVYVREWGIKAIWQTDRETIKNSINNLVDNYDWGNFVMKIFPRAISRQDGTHIYEINFSVLHGAKPLNAAKVVEGIANVIEAAVQQNSLPEHEERALPPHLRDRNAALPPHARDNNSQVEPEPEYQQPPQPQDERRLPPHLRNHQQPQPVAAHPDPAPAGAYSQPLLPGDELPEHLRDVHLATDFPYYDDQDPFAGDPDF